MPVTSTQTASIPPEVLARYNAVNTRAEQVANRPFQPYSQDASAFVAPLTQSQQSAIQNINQIQGMTEPYFQQATQMAGASTQGVYDPSVAAISSPYYQAATGATQAGMQGVSNYDIAAMSTPGYQQAGQTAQYAGRDIANANVAGISSPYYQQARQLGLGAAQDVSNQGVAETSSPYYQQAQQYTGMGARDIANLGVAMSSQPFYNQSGQMVMQGAQGVSDLGVAAASDPYYRQAQQMTGMAGQVQVPALEQSDIMRYMSPYMQQVIDPTMRALRQQQEQAMAGQTGTAIRSGAFGGDRAALAAAALAQQQQLAQGQTLGGMLQTGYGQALSTAQGQQQVRQAEMARMLQAGRQQADIGTMARQALEQQQQFAQADQARRLQAAQQYAGLGTMGREALQAQQAVAAQDAARQLQAAQQTTATGTAQRQAYEQQQAFQQADLARQLEVAKQQQGLGTAERQAYEQQQQFAQADAARQMDLARQQQALATAQRQAYEQQQAIQTSDMQRLLAGGQQLAGIGTSARQAYEQQQAIQAADLQRMQNAAQLMGNLGTSSQQAALAASQALLAAGQVEQQTQQAGLQALYNQFLQEQSYPFQTTQFLSNIATGTGALSGSSTTTAQAQPYFSDRRLKEGVGAAKYGAQGAEEPEVIGETYDGQKIYRYRLLNPLTGELEPPQIGLMADEAERRRPDAVGDAGGFQTLDYKRATDDAADIGHGLGRARMGGAVVDMEPGKDYWRGGYAGGGYVDPADFRALLESQASMYGGLGGAHSGSKGGAPYGGGGGGILAAGYVPLVDASAGHQMLKPSEAPKELTPKSTELMEGISKASETAKSFDTLHNLYKKLMNKDSAAKESHGGVAGYKVGGMPYENEGPDYFPEEVLQHKDVEVLKPSAPPETKTRKEEGFMDKASGFLDTASKAAGLGSTLYTVGSTVLPYLASLSDRRLKSGVGYADGGPTDEEDLFDRMLMRESGKKQFDKEGRTLTSPKGAAGIAQVMPGTAPEAAKLAGVPFDEKRYREDEDYNKALGKAYFKAQSERFGDPVIAAAAYNAGPARVQKALERAQLEGGNYINYLPTETQKYLAGVAGVTGGESKMPANARSFMAKYPAEGKGVGPAAGAVPPSTVVPTMEAASEKGKGIGDFLTSKEFIIPALTGLGAMASSPSRYLGSAILQGAGAGALSYMDVLGKESEIAKRTAETGEVKARTGTQEQETEKRKAETLRELQSLYKDAFFDRGGIQMVRLANGSAMSLYEWMKNPQPVWGGEETSAGAEGKTSKAISIGPTTKVEAPPGIGYDEKSLGSAQNELGMLNTPGKAALEARSAEYRNMVDKDAEVARDQKLYNNEVAGVIADMASKTGVETPGATGSLRAMIINYGNTISRSAGMGDQFGTADTSQAILDKINTLAGEARVSSAGQQALGSLTKVIGAYPNLDQPPTASSFNAASNMVNNQMKLDRQQHADTYGQQSGQLYSRAGVDFKRANTPAKYHREQDALQSTMMRDPEAFAAMVSGRVSKEDIEQYFRDKKHGGIPGMGRYFGD